MKIIMRILNVFLLVSFLSVLTSCDKSNHTNSTDSLIDPFSNGGNERNMIVVFSDAHLGADTSYAECKENCAALEKLLMQIKDAENVKELVIAGDLLDEWYIPATIETYKGKKQSDFVKSIATANKGVFDALNSIIKDNKITVTYVPGNHDLTITAENIDSVLPGINQSRDSILGLGTYSPVACPKIAIEHGHRYNFFCAPDPISNQSIASGTILPPGYFFTRIAALSVKQEFPKQPVDKIPTVSPNTSGGKSQDLLYRYWKDWDMTLTMFPITNKFEDSIIVTNVNYFKGNYSINDLLPYQSTLGGEIKVDLFDSIQDNWHRRQTLNNVANHIETARAIDSVMAVSETDRQADFQYFSNDKSDKRIVVFGHTHAAKMISDTNNMGQKTIYVNSGTWIDHNDPLKTRTFVVITPQDTINNFSQTYVKLYYMESDTIIQMHADSLIY